MCVGATRLPSRVLCPSDVGDIERHARAAVNKSSKTVACLLAAARRTEQGGVCYGEPLRLGCASAQEGPGDNA